MRFAAWLLAQIAVLRHLHQSAFVGHWATLAVIVAYLAMDESLIRHEQLTLIFRRLYHVRGFLHRAWVIPFGALLLTLVIA